MSELEGITRKVYKLKRYECGENRNWHIYFVVRVTTFENGSLIAEKVELEEFLGEVEKEDFQRIVAYLDKFSKTGPDIRVQMFRHIKGYSQDEKKLQESWDVEDLHLCECKPIPKSPYRLLGCYSIKRKFLVLCSGFDRPHSSLFNKECNRVIKILKNIQSRELKGEK